MVLGMWRYSSLAIFGMRVMSAGSHATLSSSEAVSQRAASCSIRWSFPERMLQA